MDQTNAPGRGGTRMQSGRTSLALLHASKLMHGLTMQVFMGDQPLLRFEWEFDLVTSHNTP